MLLKEICLTFTNNNHKIDDDFEMMAKGRMEDSVLFFA